MYRPELYLSLTEAAFLVSRANGEEARALFMHLAHEALKHPGGEAFESGRLPAVMWESEVPAPSDSEEIRGDAVSSDGNAATPKTSVFRDKALDNAHQESNQPLVRVDELAFWLQRNHLALPENLKQTDEPNADTTKPAVLAFARLYAALLDENGKVKPSEEAKTVIADHFPSLSKTRQEALRRALRVFNPLDHGYAHIDINDDLLKRTYL